MAGSRHEVEGSRTTLGPTSARIPCFRGGSSSSSNSSSRIAFSDRGRGVRAREPEVPSHPPTGILQPLGLARLPRAVSMMPQASVSRAMECWMRTN